MAKAGKKSGSVPKRKEIEQALISLGEMFGRWGLEAADWIIVDEMAYVLQGYEVIAREMETRHLDVYVDVTKLPWEPSKERSIIPPSDSEYFNEYCRFMKTTGFGLDMLATTPGDTILQQPVVNYVLPNNKPVRLMEAVAMTKQFWQKTLMHYSFEDVGIDKVEEWLAKLRLIQEVAQRKGKGAMAEDCQEMLGKARERWAQVLDT